MTILYVNTKEQIADVFTKALTKNILKYLIDLLNMKDHIGRNRIKDEDSTSGGVLNDDNDETDVALLSNG
jgi:hypothetical protein